AKSGKDSSWRQRGEGKSNNDRSLSSQLPGLGDAIWTAGRRRERSKTAEMFHASFQGIVGARSRRRRNSSRTTKKKYALSLASKSGSMGGGAGEGSFHELMPPRKHGAASPMQEDGSASPAPAAAAVAVVVAGPGDVPSTAAVTALLAALGPVRDEVGYTFFSNV
ncbi:unnamed protein product, partial [Heterosigma akashiwo]